MNLMPKIPKGCNPPKACFECPYVDCIRLDIKITKEEKTFNREYLPYPDRTGKFRKNNKRNKQTLTV